MNWPTAEELHAACPPADGYHYEVLSAGCVGELVTALSAWQPSWRIGAASVYMREEYYRSHVYLEGGPTRDVFVLLLRQGVNLAGMLSAERIPDALSLYASLAVAAPEHRGGNAVKFKGDYLEALARLTNLQFIYTLATLKHRGSQRYFESMGYKLVGFMPGYDQEEVSPGVIKRVVEAAYVKVLVEPEAVLQPCTENMTPTVRQLYETLFPARPQNAA